MDFTTYEPLKDSFAFGKRSSSYSSIPENSLSAMKTGNSRRSSGDLSSIWSNESSAVDLNHVSGKKTFNSLLLNDNFEHSFKVPDLRLPTAESLLSTEPFSPIDQVRLPLCKYFANGFCTKGNQCVFLHASNPTSNNLQHTHHHPQQHVQQTSTSNIPTHPVNIPNNSMAASPTTGSFSVGGLVGAIPSSSFHSKKPVNHSQNFIQQVPHSYHPISKKPATKKIPVDDGSNRFNGIPLSELLGQIHLLCTDQHGCRYLQRKLEENVPYQNELIFNHVFPHYVHLMTDPFGNYLCQRIIEHCTDAQRALIIESIAPHLVSISVNMHGTRAVQKMIDFLTNKPAPSNAPLLIQRFTAGLARHVVSLIKDLNGNHVVQKCLVRLNSAQNQFIYDAVTQCCVQVSTHRHGCCVLQRCIDYATEAQRMQLISEITYHALTLVQDPFGNYVVQYVLDLGNPIYSSSIMKAFLGHVCALSVQKFSSNVIEKAIRVAEPEIKAHLIKEILEPEKLEIMLKDLYANYVVQTALDCSDVNQRAQLIEAIKPILPVIRNTPFGKRIQTKILKIHQSMTPMYTVTHTTMMPSASANGLLDSMSVKTPEMSHSLSLTSMKSTHMHSSHTNYHMTHNLPHHHTVHSSGIPLRINTNMTSLLSMDPSLQAAATPASAAPGITTPFSNTLHDPEYLQALSSFGGMYI